MGLWVGAVVEEAWIPMYRQLRDGSLTALETWELLHTLRNAPAPYGCLGASMLCLSNCHLRCHYSIPLNYPRVSNLLDHYAFTLFGQVNTLEYLDVFS